MDLNDKVALVTGSARGLGKCLIEEFAKNKCNVVITYNSNKNKAYELKKYIEKKYNINALCIKCDITSEKEIKNMIEDVISSFEKIDILVNNAVYEKDNYIEDKSKEEFMKVLEVNLVGPFLISKYASKYIKDGIIVNISSKDADKTYNKMNIDYSASKAGLNSLTKTLSLALPHIKIISVMPGFIKTESTEEMNPLYLSEELKRIGQSKLSLPEDISSQIIGLINNKDIKTGDIIELED